MVVERVKMACMWCVEDGGFYVSEEGGGLSFGPESLGPE